MGLNAVYLKLRKANKEETLPLVKLLENLPADPFWADIEAMIPETERKDDTLCNFLYLSILKELNLTAENNDQQFLRDEWGKIKLQLAHSVRMNLESYYAIQRSGTENKRLRNTTHTHEATSSLFAKANDTPSSSYSMPSEGHRSSPLGRFAESLNFFSHSGGGPLNVAARGLNMLFLPVYKAYQYARHKLYGEPFPTLTTAEIVELSIGAVLLTLAVAAMVISAPVSSSIVIMVMSGIAMVEEITRFVIFWRENNKLNREINDRKKRLAECEADISELRQLNQEIPTLKTELMNICKDGIDNPEKLNEKRKELQILEQRRLEIKRADPQAQARHLKKELIPMLQVQKEHYSNNKTRLAKSMGSTLTTLGLIAAGLGLVGALLGPAGIPLLVAASVLAISVCVVAAVFAIGMGVTAYRNKKTASKTWVVGDTETAKQLSPRKGSLLNIEKKLSANDSQKKLDAPITPARVIEVGHQRKFLQGKSVNSYGRLEVESGEKSGKKYIPGK